MGESDEAKVIRAAFQIVEQLETCVAEARELGAQVEGRRIRIFVNETRTIPLELMELHKGKRIDCSPVSAEEIEHSHAKEAEIVSILRIAVSSDSVLNFIVERANAVGQPISVEGHTFASYTESAVQRSRAVLEEAEGHYRHVAKYGRAGEHTQVGGECWTRLDAIAPVVHEEVRAGVRSEAARALAQARESASVALPASEPAAASDPGIENVSPDRNRAGILVGRKGRWATKRDKILIKGINTICKVLAAAGMPVGPKALKAAITEFACPVTIRTQGRPYIANRGEILAWADDYLEIIQRHSTGFDPGAHEAKLIDSKRRKRADWKGKDITLEAAGIEIKTRRSDRRTRDR